MKKIVAFAGSNSTSSINKQLVEYATRQLSDVEVNLLDLNDYELPIYSTQLEKQSGHPQNAVVFLNMMREADGFIISLAEHNGAYTSVFKNLFDWLSRVEQKLFFGKPLLLMATAPGPRGGLSVLGIAADRFPRHNANLTGQFSLPSFNDNFSDGKITNEALNSELNQHLQTFKNHL